jgi:lipopolysaccharide biosynthesis glycosyltransferase
MSKRSKPIIPIFFAVDDNYSPMLGVCITSLMMNASIKYQYKFYVLQTDLSLKNQKQIKDIMQDDFSIEFVDVNKELDKFKKLLYTRDYYTNTTYYRFFIPELFTQYDKAIYLDCDIIVEGDISKFYETNLKNKLLGGITEEVMPLDSNLKAYPETVLGVPQENYFNAGVLVMNLKGLREFDILNKFLSLLKVRTFPLAQDQDCLNLLCKGQVHYLPLKWNKTPVKAPSFKDKTVCIVHYKIAWKPWHEDGILYGDLFWKYAKLTSYYQEILKIKENYSPERIARDWKSYDNLSKIAYEENLKAIKLNKEYGEANGELEAAIN